MTDRRNEGGDLSRFRDAGIAEALLRLGPAAAASHPGVPTQRAGTWVHCSCDGEAVTVREVSGAELDALRERIELFQAPFSMARSGSEDDAASGAFMRDPGRVAEELMSARPDLDTVELLRGDALAGSAALYRARLEAVDASLPAPKCPNCGRTMKRRRQKVSKTLLTRVCEVTLRRTCCHCRRLELVQRARQPRRKAAGQQ